MTTFDQLRSIASGSASFAANPVALSGSGTGFFGFSNTINFAARTMTVAVNGNYTLGISPNYSGLIYSEVFDCSARTGSASTGLGINSVSDSANFSPSFLGTGHTAVINLAVLNNTSNRTLAQAFKASLALDDGAGHSMAGTGVAPRN